MPDDRDTFTITLPTPRAVLAAAQEKKEIIQEATSAFLSEAVAIIASRQIDYLDELEREPDPDA